MTMDVLKEELTFFEEQKAELLRTRLGQFALIKGRTLVGIYPTQEEAYAEGVKRFLRGPFLIKRIVEREDPERAPLLAHLIRADL